MDIKVLEFGSLQSGWEGINEYLFTETKEIIARGGGLYGPEMVSYNNYVIMRRAWTDPELNLGDMLGYSIKKWSSLVNNYVDFRYLDMIRAEISNRTQRNSRSYNYVYHFDNSHGSGKDCLVALNIMKRIGIPHPIVLFITRTSEVTKRLIFDFILVERIIEYIYGHSNAEVHFFAPSMFLTAESFVMYDNHKPLKDLIDEPENKFQERVMRVLHEFKNHPDPMQIRYKVNRRSALQLKRDENGRPVSGKDNLLVGEMQLRPRKFEYPENVISKTQRRKFRKDERTEKN